MKLAKEREKVEAFLDNQLIVRKGFEPIDISEGINWNYQHVKNANTYQTYLHSLGIIIDLLKISKSEGNPQLLVYAKNIIMDWYQTDHTTSQNFAWREHPVSSRISNIIEFQEGALDYRLEDEIFEKIIIEHCDYLYDETHYKFNNHGLMMDYGLLDACKYVSDVKLKRMYADKAIYRVRYALLRDFTRKGVHLENSPEYHRLVLIIFRKLEKVIKDLKLSIGRDETEIIKLAIKYKNYMIQPNNYYPMIGDTGTIHDPRIKKNYNDFIDFDAGIAILNNKNEGNEIESSMLTFKSGYHKQTHKHNDDLSVSLYLTGEELLVDSGKYSYDAKDEIRQHLISPRGHSAPCIAHSNYKLVSPIKEQKDMKITRYFNKNGHKLVSGVNRLYANASLTRHNILSKDDIYFVVDRIVSKEKGLFYQNFNLNENAEVNKIDDLTFEISLNNKKFILKSYERYDSNLMTEINSGYVSRAFGEYKDNKRVLVKQTNLNSTFVTVILPKEKFDLLSDVNFLNSSLRYSFDGNEFEIII
ncbi:heparinase II/III family protein [Jeotgalicoccus sp. ATCC 8456]|uniref:heparinase II/III family protein n=1 Tax=Jeotgalicoccus sp. ATCC 8456 TaxID=946435 RepID=UPI0018E61542|nr:heparinase II/III family protein [Jeotgalicoccus sp. ATCC 8456]QQD85658.1 heparinase II/III family protein [Jeotgalicoccus sp. ATCC 8456]